MVLSPSPRLQLRLKLTVAWKWRGIFRINDDDWQCILIQIYTTFTSTNGLVGISQENIEISFILKSNFSPYRFIIPMFYEKYNKNIQISETWKTFTVIYTCATLKDYWLWFINKSINLGTCIQIIFFIWN